MNQERVPYTMRSPCAFCGNTIGHIEYRGGQACVFCQECKRLVYNAPKTELGERPRTVATVHNGIKPKKRMRILERATGRCELCGAQTILHVSHILSVSDGLNQGLTETEINHDENLAALCEECNLGLGGLSYSPRLYIALLRRRVARG